MSIPFIDRVLAFLNPRFGQVRLSDHFEILSGGSYDVFVGFVSSRSRAFLVDETAGRRRCFFHHGKCISLGGVSGYWHFFNYFLLEGRPLIFDTGEKSDKYCGFFQTRSFTISRNIGYLQYNLEKILDHLLYESITGYSRFNEASCSGEDLLGGFVFFIRMWFWKIHEKLLKPRWHLCKLSMPVVSGKSKLQGKSVMAKFPRALADPMVATTEEGAFLFMEEVVSGKGRISFVELQAGTMRIINSTPSVLLQRETHLSYPFVFRVGMEWFMLPESSDSRDLIIYRASSFPRGWEVFRTVVRGEEWIDTTPFLYKGMWWIFTVRRLRDHASAYQELYLYYCRDILHDQWMPHRQNPVVSDSRHARPGGALFHYKGRVYRPAQNCLDKYGGSLWLCEVVALSEYEYREVPVRELKFSNFSRLSSFHTITWFDNQVIGDCYY